MAIKVGVESFVAHVSVRHMMSMLLLIIVECINSGLLLRDCVLSNDMLVFDCHSAVFLGIDSISGFSLSG